MSYQNEKFGNAVNISRIFIESKVNNGDIVVDATAGNGNDSKFLAEVVGRSGKVYAFDIQDVAIQNTREILTAYNLIDRVELICDSHERIDEYVNDELDLALFNLGFLPGGSKNITTKPKGTIIAINKCLNKLKKGGVVLLVVYYGHPTGCEEKEKVLAFTSTLDQQMYSVFNLLFSNQKNNPPLLIGIEKRL